MMSDHRNRPNAGRADRGSKSMLRPIAVVICGTTRRALSSLMSDSSLPSRVAPKISTISFNLIQNSKRLPVSVYG